MKRWLIASSFCAIPVLILSIAIPMVVAVSNAGKVHLRDLWILAIILMVSLLVIVTTTLRFIHYADAVDRLDEERENLRRECNRLSGVINKLITNEKEKV